MTKHRSLSGRSVGKLLASTILAVSIWHSPGHAQSAGFTPILPDFSDVVKDKDWAQILGKSLFWDEKLGSDGMACASCHFSAGADPRTTAIPFHFRRQCTLARLFAPAVRAQWIDASPHLANHFW